MTALPLFHVDAFSLEPFRGNPAVVCLLDGPRDAAWMQTVAAELRLSETAFVEPRGDEAFRLRWFTPVTEADLCGHATLASAHVLWETARLDHHEPARFDTASGRLTCTFDEGEVHMDFPAVPVAPVIAIPPGLTEALGVEPIAVFRNRLDLLVELPDADDVTALAPDLAALAAIDTRGVIVTASSDHPGVDFVSRFFAPRAGIDEDPVTGSAHCALGPFWAERLGGPELVGYQASARGGVVAVRVGSEVGSDRVVLAGYAVTVARGELLV